MVVSAVMTWVGRRANLEQVRVSSRQKGNSIMRIKLNYFSTLLAAGAVAVAVAGAPIAAAASAPASASASAETQQSCSQSGSGTLCQSPGNAQINDSPPPVQYYPYGGEAFLL
jgi:hypothetical protein